MSLLQNLLSLIRPRSERDEFDILSFARSLNQLPQGLEVDPSRVYCGPYLRFLATCPAVDSDPFHAAILSVVAKYPFQNQDGPATTSPSVVQPAHMAATLFSSLSAIQGTRCLDIGCGSTSESYEDRTTRQWEPWFPRFLAHHGAIVTGIDIGQVEAGEPYTHIQGDITSFEVLRSLPAESFDRITCQAVFDSPTFMITQTRCLGRSDITAQITGEWLPTFVNEVDRLLAPGGKAVIITV